MSTPLLLPPYYLPSVAWWALAYAGHQQGQPLVLGTGGLYRKQTPHSRAYIKRPEGIQRLSITVVQDGLKTPLAEARLTYREPWNRTHVRSVEAALRRSPFYLHYADDIAQLLMTPHDRLLDLNVALIQYLGKRLGLAFEVSADNVAEAFGLDAADAPGWFAKIPYFQQFDGFVPNLSLVDLLCNEGPRTHTVLRGSVQSFPTR